MRTPCVSRGGTGCWERVALAALASQACVGGLRDPRGQLCAPRPVVGRSQLRWDWLPCRGPGGQLPTQAELARETPGPVVLAAETSGGKDDPLELHGPLGPGQLAAPVRRQWTEAPFSGLSVRPSHPASLAPYTPRVPPWCSSWLRHRRRPSACRLLPRSPPPASSLQPAVSPSGHFLSSSSVPPSAPLTDIWSRVSWLEGGAENFHGRENPSPPPIPKSQAGASELGLVPTMWH